MKKKIIEFRISDAFQNRISMFPENYSHFRFKKNGFVFYSKKGINLPRVYLNKEDVCYIIY